MERVKVARNFQVTIPAGIKERLGIRVGDVLLVYVEGDKIVFRKPSNERRKLIFGRKLTLEDIETGIERGVVDRGGNNRY
ncbi:AbrB/MazE/SpoVT family DNA-binding domain-containing protein [Vulcanisaeta sp. JCM 14467]|uniref:AbrB/MazE/SpoVT family DNA-binding domain-containing protein n=1 Tax=Vulcanisaeta sp. JCM 14467 TaxID=1295370 RepID=UPI0006D2A319|nr:AbrB/MazE/SpoVT family DNA-binding domain-containing protein [Vulcanisaeta sp. JCM 14467]